MRITERGATPTQIAIGAAVLCFIFIAWLNTGGSFNREYHEDLAYDCFEALKENDFDKYGDKMIEARDEDIDSYSYKAYYTGIMEHAGGHDALAEQYKKRARTEFVGVRKRAAKDFKWADAEWDGAHINKKSGSSENKLRGFYVEANGKRYQFRFAKPEPGLYIIMYNGVVKP